MIRSARNTASSTSWVTKITVLRRPAQGEQLELEPFPGERVQAPKGSSISSTSGSAASVRAMATRWRMPPEIRLV